MKHLKDNKIYFRKKKTKQNKTNEEKQTNKQKAGQVTNIITSKYLKQFQCGSSDKEKRVQLAYRRILPSLRATSSQAFSVNAFHRVTSQKRTLSDRNASTAHNDEA